ncbi:leucyl aminopeptidase family protein [Labedaea rhizosphaerae]|uniref:Probable cytosol aminopeptidase n=1 Tax=Labedaea rhizosphaerae TaxID=598644 RepID=A0A4R6S3D8_LABRH|nr:leucyl aminopeptidase family protein [Labedaea rhizosphaerae]TDP93813.1 leucyl aminopeptidase [Labedaea rhizosphaerae]
MPSPLPTLPTALPGLEVAKTVRRGVPLAVVAMRDDEGEPLVGPGGEAITTDWVADAGLTAGAGQVLSGPSGTDVRWVVGLGDGAVKAWRTAGAALTRAVNTAAAADEEAGRAVQRNVQVVLPPDAGAEQVGQFALGVFLGGYKFVVTEQEAKPRLRTLTLITGGDFAEVVARAHAQASATALTRDLANSPSNIKDPAWLARTVSRIAGKVNGLAVQVRDEQWLARNGFGGVLAVGGGSDRPPRLVELSWAPRGVKGPHLVFVGKGITFDTGGISIKPADGMHLMRTDMAGGAAVMSAVLSVARLGLPVRVTGLVPCAENHVSGSAYRPGDVVRHFGGKTTEVTNTDAEGRMVLADGLAYAVAELGADLLVDVATLTGAMKVSLGTRTAGLFATDDDLADRVRAAGERVGEAFWRMPLGGDCDTVRVEMVESVRSDLADVRQCPPGAGAITAALFLHEFTGGLPWAHLDIAGPARADKVYDEVVPGASGFAARTLVELAASYA